MARTIKRALLSASVVAAAAITLVGCGGSDSTSDTAAEPSEAPASASEPEDASAEATDLKVGVSYPTSNSPFWQNYMAFVEDGANQLGIELNSVSADGKEEKQLADVQNLISQGIDGLVVTPVSTAISPRILEEANRAGIQVVVTDRYPGYEPGTDPTADYVAFIGPNDVQAGQGIIESLADAGATKVVALGGIDGSSVAEGRKQGLQQGADAKGVEIVQYEAVGETEEDGLNTMESLLQANPSGTIDGVWCYNDNLCIGAIKAAQNANRLSELTFGGMDLTPEAITAIEAGDYSLSYGGHWLQGGFGLATLYDALNGLDPKTPLVKLDLMKVDGSNVAQFKDQFITNPPVYDFDDLSQVTNPDATGSFEIAVK